MPSTSIDSPGFAAPATPYATPDDVRNALGSLRDRLPSWVDLDEFLLMAHAQVIDLLSSPYPTGIPDFTGPAANSVRYAEAKIAAAEILESIRVNLPDLGEAPRLLRETAEASLTGGIAGYPIGGIDVDDDGDPETPAVQATTAPRVSSFTPLSAFPDPYEAARLDPLTDVVFSDRPIRYQ